MNIKIFKILFVVIIIGVLGFGTFLTYSKNKPLPEKFTLAIPFSPQAPNNNWDRNLDCEETSITMANAFLTGNYIEDLPPQDAQTAINNLKTWENKNLGYNEDTGSYATAKMAEGAFGLKTKRLENFTAEDLKRALYKNQPILLPLNAKIMNPEQYEVNGPVYHMIVIRGYDGNNFITNDPGTNGGKADIYSFETLQKAAADWDQNTKSVKPEIKVALVVYK